MKDVIIIGAGPCGISAAIELKKQGFQPLIIEKGCLVHSIYHYPLSMQFFSTPDKLEIGGVPFISINEKPTRHEALKYFRTVVRIHELDIHTYEEVTRVDRLTEGFQVITEGREGQKSYQTRYLILATGYYDTPNLINIQGEDLPHVHHYFHDSHPFADQEVVVIGGRNSAIDTALELQQAGARVTMVYRKTAFHSSVKAWVRPLIESAIEKGRIGMHWGSEVREIKRRSVVIEKEGEILEIPADTVFAMTGYRPNLQFIEQLGGEINPQTGAPVCSEAMETTVSGLYLAGVIATGHDSTKIFIENGRFHGHLIANDLKQKEKCKV
ncbi:YpdA family putative bacillithiol disulfide reductase [Paenactinomyces guangxiensis]|uniref:YpdA family putative bacillithiol disulfide reductase n=1 Tax=Paenactinomyces guangxiensis TaxID=1490290 RepID=A0A7W1WTC3_9BACL|nr:YpdA family putative bacillithiol disulfide reductase [Paenactinomyces guangxiensis]MBA4495629.1 YpdA family putative bacillithiol disulfide reductase [Paenactinomyces guangxiensis]MBH8592617.1 YpdA family putative bacillithiol disulfide reductase [Paenactinomyces guangxiensis]